MKRTSSRKTTDVAAEYGVVAAGENTGTTTVLTGCVNQVSSLHYSGLRF